MAFLSVPEIDDESCSAQRKQDVLQVLSMHATKMNMVVDKAIPSTFILL